MVLSITLHWATSDDFSGESLLHPFLLLDDFLINDELVIE